MKKQKNKKKFDECHSCGKLTNTNKLIAFSGFCEKCFNDTQKQIEKEFTKEFNKHWNKNLVLEEKK